MKRAIFAAVAFMLCSRLAAQQQEIFVPQVVAGRDSVSGLFLQTTFYMWSESDTEIEAQIDLFTNDGRPMNAFLLKAGPPAMPEFGSSGTLTIYAHGATRPETTTAWYRPPEEIPFLVGWAKVTTSAPVGLIVTLSSVDIFEGSSRVVTSTSLTPDPVGVQFSTYGLVTTNAKTGLAILNPSPTEVSEVRIRYFNTLGFDKGEVLVTLPPRGKVVEFLDEKDFFPDILSLEGTLVITGSRPVSAVAIRVDGLNWSGFRLVGQ